MPVVQIASNLTAGANALRFALPVANGLTCMHLFNSTYLQNSGASLANLAYVGAPASAITGAPTFDAYGMMPQVFGDGALSSAYDVFGDISFWVVAASYDSLAGNSNSPVYLTGLNQDGSSPLAGAKGLMLSMNNGSGNVATIANVARTSNVVTVNLSAAPTNAFTTGQLIMVAGVAAPGDPTMNTAVPVAMTVNSSTQFTYPSTGANLAQTTVTGATCWNGVGGVSATDSTDQPSPTTSITSISRTSNTVTMVVGTIISGLTLGGPVVVQGVTGDTTLNGLFAAASISGTTVTYTSVGSNSTGTVSGATAGLGTLNRLYTTQTEVLMNKPRFLAATFVAATGIRTLYDFTANATPNVNTFPGPRVGPSYTHPNQPFQFGTGLFGVAFGKCKMFAAGIHNYALSQAAHAENYATMQAKMATMGITI